MGFFDEDDPFDSIVREFFGASPVRKTRKERFIKGEDEDRTIDFVEDENQVYLVFDFPGFKEKDISVDVKGYDLKISAKKSNGEIMQDYLNQKLKQGIIIQKKLPSVINTNKMCHSVNNGVLEIIFDKHKKNDKRN